VDEGGFKSRPGQGTSTYALIQAALREARSNNWLRRLPRGPNRPKAFRKSTPEAFVQPIAAGEKVVAETRSTIYEFIRSTYNDAYAVEMEGLGFLFATYAYPDMGSLVVRGISDLIAGKATADATGSHEWASTTASAFAFQVLSTLISPSHPPDDPPVALAPTTPSRLHLPKKLPRQPVEE